MSDEVAARKRRLRAEARRLRAEALRQPAETGEAAARQALANLMALEELASARTISLYAATEGEVPVAGALSRFAGGSRRAAFPRVEGDELVLHEVSDASALRPGYRGIPEPPESAPRVAPGEVDAFVVPGLRFDRRGRRLGRGGGHYDRLLARARADAIRIGICYADAVTDELPADAWDEPMDVVVSDREVIRPPPRARPPARPRPGAR